MEEWKEYKLGEISFLSTGFPFKGDKYSKIGTRVVRGDNITIGQLRWDTDKDKRWNECFEREADFSLRANDIVIGMDGSRVGMNRAQIKESDLPLLLAQRVACVRNNEKSVQKFIYYHIFSKRFVDYVKSIHTGTSIPHISLKQIGDFPISLPSLLTQQKIANILSSLDEKIEVNRRINDNLEQQAQALYKQWFVDNSSEEWEEKSLGEIINIYDSLRRPLSGHQRDKMEKIYPYYGAASLMDYVDNYLFDGVYLLLGEDGTVVDNLGYPILQYVWGKFWVNNHAHILTGANGYSTETLYILLKQTSVKSIVTGAVQPKISQANLKSIQIVTPPIDLLDKFNKLITPLFDNIRNNIEQNHRLTTLRDTLLPKLMSGELSVEDVSVD